MGGRDQSPLIHYSESFKQKVISEIEKGSLTAKQAREKYGIGGGSTIQSWMKKFGKYHLLRKVVVVKDPGESDYRKQIKELKREKQELESAFAQLQLKNMAYETLLEIGKEEFGLDLKKNAGFNVLGDSQKRSKKRKRK